ncbi:restriction endonuclease subunit S [Akkermansia muciniphila]|uniref:restriction endonuclease subunit S n=1 Tax=Akkermansia muciniphila TaxID=239935 RepID=UPI00138E852E|nr:restriction endonuclease subunit S [Akkermansia muciniphila]QHV09993.1 hypothetical protein C5N96_09595 [Akkermansia muciniphila]QHV14626.1 hypothetical protein C5O09_09895 [Akkermansia muciniphila]QHV17097.1 hypothetical protein C5O10_09935 [Akkermansia muciniphila]
MGYFSRSVIFHDLDTDNLPYEKVGKNEPVCIADEVPFEIPDTWEWVRFSAVIELQSGQDMTPDKYNSAKQGIPYLTGASNIENEKVIINRWTEYGKAFAYKGDLLITCKGTIGTMAILEENQVHIARQIMAIRSGNLIKIEYIQLVLETLVASLKAAAKSMIPGVSREDILSSLLPLPPYNEQSKIIAFFKSVTPFIDEYSKKESQLQNLNCVFPELLKKSILQEAVQGKLVPQDPADEPASVLLKRIRSEKEQLIKAGKIKRDKHESVIFRRDNSHYEKLDGIDRCIDDEIPFEIPDSWVWERWGNISQSIQYGYNAPAKDCGRIKMVRISDIQDNSVLWETVPYCDIKENEISTYLLQPNDILFARTGGTVGKSYLVQEVPEEAIYAGYLIRTRYSQWVYPQYLKFFMESELYWSQLRNGTIATAQPNCNGRTLGKMLLPIPPLSEQYRIVEKVNVLFGHCNSI